MSLIIETDIGRDPDDLLALIYLCEAGKKIDAVVVSPGDRDQLAVASMVRSLYGQNWPIGACESVINKKDRRSSNKFHERIMEYYGLPTLVEADGVGPDILNSVHKNEDQEFFIIGPAKNIYNYLSPMNPSWELCPNRVLMQGGFCPYSAYSPSVRLPKFEGLEYCPSFNPGGEPRAIPEILASFSNTDFVGKNVCHTVEYDRNENRPFKSPRLDQFFNGWLKKAKRLHDVVAAVCLVKPQIGVWIRGVPAREKGKYTTILSAEPNRRVLVDIDRGAFWNEIQEVTNVHK